MNSPFLHPTVIALAVLVLAMCACSVVQFAFLRGLRNEHPAQWRHAGQPTMWTAQSLISAWPTISYLQRRAYRSSGNAAGIAFCDRYRAALLTGYWCTVVAVLFLFMFVFTAGWPNEWT